MGEKSRGDRLRAVGAPDAASLVKHTEGPVKVHSHLHPSPGKGGTVPTGWNIDQGALEADGVVVADNAPVLVAEDVVEAPGGRPGDPGAPRILRRHREPTVVPGQVAR